MIDPLTPTYHFNTAYGRVALGYGITAWTIGKALDITWPGWPDLVEGRAKQTTISLNRILVAAKLFGVPANQAVAGRDDLIDVPDDVVFAVLDRLSTLCPYARQMFIDKRRP